MINNHTYIMSTVRYFCRTIVKIFEFMNQIYISPLLQNSELYFLIIFYSKIIFKTQYFYFTCEIPVAFNLF